MDLLRVNRQISKEGSNVLYNQDPFVVVNLDPSIPFLPSIIAGQFSESQHDVADELVSLHYIFESVPVSGTCETHDMKLVLNYKLPSFMNRY